jgi:uncharacterized protein YndB with AHSA1/START domain
MNQQIEKSILIHASPQVVWKYLTTPDLMSQWMGEPELNIKVITDWKVGGPILIKGFHHVKFENKGFVMHFDPYRLIRYSHLSSISGLPGSIDDHSLITFLMEPKREQTLLKLHIEHFVTDTIYRHLAFYWEGTLEILKKMIEKDTFTESFQHK